MSQKREAEIRAVLESEHAGGVSSFDTGHKETDEALVAMRDRGEITIEDPPESGLRAGRPPFVIVRLKK
jgi:hypothetical protein